MFSAPEHGWCRVSIGDWSVSGSYLEDYPLTVPEALLAITENSDASELNGPISSFMVEAESAGTFEVEIHPDRIEVREWPPNPDNADGLAAIVPITPDSLPGLFEDAARDLAYYMDEWIWNWDYIPYDEDGELDPHACAIALEREQVIAKSAMELLYESNRMR